MSTKYVLQCPSCRKQHLVQSSQAGTSLACRCGRTVNVPSMRHLRDLPTAAEPSSGADSHGDRGSSGWGFRQALASIALLLGTLAAVLAIYVFVTRPGDPHVLAEQRYASELKQLEARSQRMTIVESFQLWADLENNGISIPVPVPPELVALREQYQVYRFRFFLSLAIAVLSFALAGACWFWPAGRRNHR